MPKPSSMLLTLILALLLWLGGGAPATAAERHAALFAEYGQRGAWVVQHAGQPPQVLHGRSLAEQAFPPASSFKTLLALIALQSGALAGPDEVVPWDGRHEHRPEWRTDMALRQAMQTSSESYFRTIAARTGLAGLASGVEQAGYGNQQLGDDPERVWVDGTLRISALEQVEFMDRLRRAALPFERMHQHAIRDAMADAPLGEARIHAKTGTLWNAQDKRGLGWWVGWMDGPQGATSFALLVQLEDRMDGREPRIELGRRLLELDLPTTASTP